MQVYTYSKVTKIIFIILSVMLTVASIGAIVDGLYEWQVHDKPGMLFITAIGIFLLGITVGAVNDIFANITIDKYSIKYQSRLYSREIALADIKGYRLNDKNNSIYVYSTVPGQKQVTVSPYLKNIGKLHVYFSSNFTNLDDKESEDEYQEVAEELGKGAEARIKQATYAMYGCNVIIISLAVLTFMFNASYPWLPIALFCTMLPLFGVMYYYQGIYRVVDSKKSKVPAVMTPFFVIGFGMFLATVHSHVLGYEQVFKTTVFITIPLLIIFLYLSRNAIGKNKAVVIGVSLLYMLPIGGAAYGFTLGANRYFDKDTSTTYTAEILAKWISRGKSNTYYVRLQPWGPVTDEDEETVRASFYHSVTPPQSVHVYLHEGFLKIPWYTMEGEE